MSNLSEIFDIHCERYLIFSYIDTISYMWQHRSSVTVAHTVVELLNWILYAQTDVCTNTHTNIETIQAMYMRPSSLSHDSARSLIHNNTQTMRHKWDRKWNEAYLRLPFVSINGNAHCYLGSWTRKTPSNLQ